MLQLTSYNRMLRYICSTAGSSLNDTKAQKQMIINWILVASKQIETFLGRQLAITAYTEYFDTITDRDCIFFVKGYPIVSLTDVFLDGEGKFDGGESEIVDCITGKNSDSVILPIPPSVKAFKAIRVRYTGGLAYFGERTLLTVSGITGSWTVGKFITGTTSEAVGIVKAVTLTTITVEILYGIFEAGEALAQYDLEDLSGSSTATATLSAVTQQSLAETYPDIVRACEIQVRHYWKHKDDFELSSTSKDGTNQRRISLQDRSPLTAEVMALLTPYRRLSV